MKKKKSAIFLGVLAMAFTVVCLSVAGGKQAQVDKDVYPYAPSMLQYNKTGAEFTPPETCGECHSKQYEEWTGSMHALAWKDPVYQGELYIAIKALGADGVKHCIGCHTPAAFVTGEVKGAGLAGLSPLAMGGVSCDVCHSVSGGTGLHTPFRQPGNTSLILSPGRDSEDGPVLIKHTPYKPEEGCGGDFHECIETPFLSSGEFCASCHQVFHPEAHTPLESTFLEWKAGPYAARDISCQDCHMVDVETFKRSADQMVKPVRGEYRHYFNGANFLLYFLTEVAAKKDGDEKLAANARHKFDMAVARLQATADIEVYPVYRNNRLVEIKVRVKNIRAGHNLPTSLSHIRQIWLEVTAKDKDGNIIMTTGTVDQKGNLPKDVRLFNKDGQGDNFHFALDPWEVTSFSRDNTILPRGYRDVHYGLSVRKGDPITITVKLRYRQADQKVAEHILSNLPPDMDLEAIYGLTAVPILPVVDMVEKNVTINTES